ncbi:menaquinone biosynthesis decarboxylase [Halosquirtibacter xylanolyticus]|uniref:menaquinone biosynthesis decarboxylase n=1 Tax=Halosquirtibacter xylanolyticus TaxID=3374599 RepID=UPI0037498DBC|nr:menaquinone biosynthesis decarboxylase [Prolixibacteraceae bacterium]
MAFKELTEFVDQLDREGELIRVKEKVSPDMEITEIVDRFSKSDRGGKALLFENNGTEFPVLINAMGSTKRISMALGCFTLDQVGERIDHVFSELTSPKLSWFDKFKMIPTLKGIASWMPQRSKGRGKCQEVVLKGEDVDLSKLPILRCWPADGGPFITLPCVVTEDPDTKIRNVGMYRMQVLDNKTTGMHWHKHKTGARHYNRHKELGTKMPVSVVLGGDPSLIFSATAPLPDNIDEYLLAGFLRDEAVDLVKCVTNDLYVPSNADIIIEGYVDPEEELVWEGPFGDHTGFYSLADWYPRFHVTCITYKNRAIYPATIVGIPPMEDAYIQRASERIFLAPMKLVMVPEIIDMDLPPAGVAHNITLAQIDKTFAGQANKVAYSMWGAGQMMFNKVLVVTNGEKANVHSYRRIARIISKNVNVARDVFFSKGPMDVLDHSSNAFAYGSKMGVDATEKLPEEKGGVDENVIEGKPIHFVAPLSQPSYIESFDGSLWEDGISILIISVNKDASFDIKEASRYITEEKAFAPAKFIVVVDNGVDITDYDFVSWYCSGNIDPLRDCKIYDPFFPNGPSRMIIDGTRKTETNDGFQRLWPNPVVSDDEMIEQVDTRWEQLGLGSFISSPSKRYKSLQRGTGAVAEDIE